VKPRFVQKRLLRLLQNFPVVALIGARQVGKSTLAQYLASTAWPARYATLDDPLTLSAATSDPDGWLRGFAEGPVFIDEIQRVPDLLRAVKLSVDQRREPGRFLLTGSANFLTLAKIGESLAGRVAIVELLPFAWREIAEQPPPTWLKGIFAVANASQLLDALERRAKISSAYPWHDEILWGGFPPVRLLMDAGARLEWFRSYQETYLNRDIREIANIHRIPDFNRLLVVLASRTGQILNVAEVARELGMQEMTVRRYIGLLETTFQISRVYPYFVNIGKRVVKRPKIYFIDTGLVCHLMGLNTWESVRNSAKFGSIVETWVAGELRKWMNAGSGDLQLYYWRTHQGHEVDFLLVKGEQVVAFEVKTSVNLPSSSFRSLAFLKGVLGERLRLSVVLYGGEEPKILGPSTVAVPLQQAFGPTAVDES